MQIPIQKTHFLELYRAAHNNAVELLGEAEILFEKGKYQRAYFLAFTGLEEIAKCQLAADVSTGFIEEASFGAFSEITRRKLVEWRGHLSTRKVTWI